MDSCSASGLQLASAPRSSVGADRGNPMPSIAQANRGVPGQGCQGRYGRGLRAGAIGVLGGMPGRRH